MKNLFQSDNKQILQSPSLPSTYAESVFGYNEKSDKDITVGSDHTENPIRKTRKQKWVKKYTCSLIKKDYMKTKAGKQG